MKHPYSIEPLEARIAPAGLVAFDYNAGTGELVLTGDAEPNAFDIFLVAPGTYRIEGREDAVTLRDTSIGEQDNGATTIRKLTKLTINSGEGDDEIDLANLRTLASLAVNTAGGNDTVDAYNLTTAGEASFLTGGGGDEVRLSGLSTVIGQNLAIGDSEGGVSFEFAAASSRVRGEVRFTGGTGSDELITSAETNLTVTRGILFDGGSAGANAINFGDQGAINIGKLATGQSILFTGGAGSDLVSIGANNVMLKGSIEMDGRAGADTIDLDGVRVIVGRAATGASLLLTGAAGADKIDVRGANVKISGSIRLDGGTEADVLDLTNVHVLSVAGAIELDGGGGADRLTIEAEALLLGGNVKLLGRDDADLVSIEGDGTIKGSVELMLGGATGGTQQVNVRGLSGLSNSLKIGGGVTLDASAASAASVDFFRLTNVVVTKAVSLVFGDGVSDVDIDNLTASDLLTIDTRGGADDVRIDRDAVFGVSQFRNAAVINLGEGDDLLHIGKDGSDNRVMVLANLSVDGSSDSDGRNDIQSAN